MRTVFFDVDTQLDFLYPAGALYVRGAETIVAALGQLTNFAAANRIPILSTADAHTEDDAEFRTWKPHCVQGTVGQQKAAVTLLRNPVVVTTAPGALDTLQPDIASATQIIIEKQQLDCFTNPNLRPLLDQMRADRYVVYGVVTELCVRCAAVGLLETGARVELVADAIKSLSAEKERETIEQFRAAGGILTTTAAVLG